MTDNDIVAARHVELEAALTEWRTATSAHDGAAHRHAKLVARTPAICRALKVTAHELGWLRHWHLTGTHPRPTDGGSYQTRAYHYSHFIRSKVAQDWHARLNQAEADERVAFACLADATRALVHLIGLASTAHVTGLTEGQARGLCRRSVHGPTPT